MALVPLGHNVTPPLCQCLQSAELMGATFVDLTSRSTPERGALSCRSWARPLGGPWGVLQSPSPRTSCSSTATAGLEAWAPREHPEVGRRQSPLPAPRPRVPRDPSASLGLPEECAEAGGLGSLVETRCPRPQKAARRQQAEALL